MFDLTDAEALGALDYDLRWQVALDLKPEEAHTCQKTLHHFRAKLMGSDKAKILFEEMTGRIIDALGVKTEKQRLDSTHITSNMARLTRLGLFVETARLFLKELRKRSHDKFESVPKDLRRRYVREDMIDSSYEDARSGEARRRLGVCAKDLWRLADRFKGDEGVEALGTYGLVKRLLDEQCEVAPDEAVPVNPSTTGVGEAPEAEIVAPREPKDIPADSLQSPHDPDATYGYKGKGYEVQLAETCGNDATVEIITRVDVTRSCDSDEDVIIPAVDDLAERKMQPKEMLGDTAYGSTENAIECERKGTELVSPVAGPKVGESKDGKLGESGFNKRDFDVDPKGERSAHCPAGGEAISEKRDGETGRVRAYFDGKVCGVCPHRERCPAKPLRDGRRVLRTTVHATVLAERRKYGRTEEFKRRYAKRAGIEATNSELKRAHGLGRLRVRGGLRVRLAVYLKALACNVKRMVKHLVRRAARAAGACLPPGKTAACLA